MAIRTSKGWVLYCGACYEPLELTKGKWVTFDVPYTDGTADHYCVDCWEEDIVEDIT